jgi:hypothetical protein
MALTSETNRLILAASQRGGADDESKRAQLDAATEALVPLVESWVLLGLEQPR